MSESDKRSHTTALVAGLMLAVVVGLVVTPSQALATPADPSVTAFVGPRIVVTVVKLIDEDDQEPIGHLLLAAQAPQAVSTLPTLGTGWFQAVVIRFKDNQWCLRSGSLSKDDFETTPDRRTSTVRVAVDCLGLVELTFVDDAVPSSLGSSVTGVVYQDGDGDRHSWEINFSGTDFRSVSVSGTAAGHPVQPIFTQGGVVAETGRGRSYTDLCELTLRCSPSIIDTWQTMSIS